MSKKKNKVTKPAGKVTQPVDDENRDTEVDDVAEAPTQQEIDEEENESFQGRDRRKHRRVKVKLHMIYEDGKTGIKTNVINISMGGAFLELPRPVNEGAEIRLTPILPDKKLESSDIQLKGRVVRVVEYNLPEVGKKTGVGIQFTNITSNESSILSEIFRKSVDEAKSENEKEEEKESPDSPDESSKTGEWTPPLPPKKK
jgi:hypothetical protein